MTSSSSTWRRSSALSKPSDAPANGCTRTHPSAKRSTDTMRLAPRPSEPRTATGRRLRHGILNLETEMLRISELYDSLFVRDSLKATARTQIAVRTNAHLVNDIDKRRRKPDRTHAPRILAIGGGPVPVEELTIGWISTEIPSRKHAPIRRRERSYCCASQLTLTRHRRKHQRQAVVHHGPASRSGERLKEHPSVGDQSDARDPEHHRITSLANAPTVTPVGVTPSPSSSPLARRGRAARGSRTSPCGARRTGA